LWATFYHHSKSHAIILTKKQLALHFGPFFAKDTFQTKSIKEQRLLRRRSELVLSDQNIRIKTVKAGLPNGIFSCKNFLMF
jgi:hypothetical protein